MAQGANGNTCDQILDALHLPKDKTVAADLFHELSENFEKSNERMTLTVANHIYVQEGAKVSKEFNDVATKKFNSGADVLDFSKNTEAATIINKWVENKTHDKIKDLVKPDTLGADTKLVLVNAIYFKAFWKEEFYKPNTAPGKFYINEKDTVDAKYMHIKEGFQYAVLDELDATAVKFPYIGTDITFVVILPNKISGLSEVEDKFKDFDLSKLDENLNTAEVDVSLPKFKIEFEIQLNDVLEKVGNHMKYLD